MTRNQHQPQRERDSPARHDPLARRSDDARIRAERQHLVRTLTETAVVTVVLAGIFELTSSHSLHAMVPYLLAWSLGWALASLSLRITRFVKRGRSSRGKASS